MKLTIDDILEKIPHRYPYLMIDCVEEATEDKVVAYKSVTYNEPHMQGHFPGNHVMPGTLILEGMAQAGLFFEGSNFSYLVRVDKFRLKNIVLPGSVIRYDLKKLKFTNKLATFSATAKIGDRFVASAEIMVMNHER